MKATKICSLIIVCFMLYTLSVPIWAQTEQTTDPNEGQIEESTPTVQEKTGEPVPFQKPEFKKMDKSEMQEKIAEMKGKYNRSSKTEASGKARLVEGICSVEFEKEFTEGLNDPEAVSITVTPLGECNGLFIYKYNESGFTVKEMGEGKSGVEFFWIAVTRSK
ncbi:hypothetical protein JW877_10405 [bacterium]|nr:hypothetical protein [bacterium]